jgi:large repetitive protein
MRFHFIALCVGMVVMNLLGASSGLAEMPVSATTASIPGYQTNLTYDSDGYLGVRDTKVLKHLTFLGKGQLLQLTNPISVTQGGEVLRNLVAQRWDLGVSGTVGLFDYVHVSFYLPLTIFQSAEFPGQKVGAVDAFGVGDLRMLVKGSIPLPKSQPYHLAVVSDFIIPSGNEDAYMGMAGPGWRNDVVFEFSRAGWGSILNLGYQIQADTEVYNIIDGDKIFYGLGGKVRLMGNFDAAVTMNGWISAVRPFYHAPENGLEMMFGLRYHFDKDWQFEGGGGLPISGAYGVPLSRFSLGASYTYHLDLDKDNDGLLDFEDQCPDEPEDIDGQEDEDGCPDPDSDNDGLTDDVDGCPEEAEDMDGFEDEDGCPEPDNDEDGLLDSEDECPNEPEDIDDHKDHDGCLDEDDDGDDVDNKDDKCPDDKEDVDGFEDEDGCPDLDNDNDSVLDVDDKCPIEAEDIDEFEDEDGCPEEDNDQDGIFDVKDKCPLDAETFNEFEDDDGCPDKRVQMVMIERDKIVIPQKIHFGSGKMKPLNKSIAVLKKVAEVLIKHPEVKKLEIQGHTDVLGKKSYNLKLSQQRAEAIKDVLTGFGVENNRLVAKGYGPEMLIDFRKTKKAHYHNRRVEFVVVEMEELKLNEEEAKLYQEERVRQGALTKAKKTKKALSVRSTIKSVKVGLRDGKLSIHVKSTAPINALKVKGNISDESISIKVRNAKLKPKKRVFKHRGIKIKAKQVKKDVHFEVDFRKNLECSGNIKIVSSSKGVRALSQCSKVPRAVTRAAEKKKATKSRVRNKTKKQPKRTKIRNKKRPKRGSGDVTTQTD